MRAIILITTGCLFIKASVFCQNVGIGTSTPSTKLTVQTPLNTAGYTHIGGSNEILVTEAIGGVSASIGTASNHPFRITSNNTGWLHVYTGGEVVVGTNTTGAFGKLTVATLNNSYGISHIGENGNILATRMGGTSAGIGTFSNLNMRLFCNSNNALIIDAANGNIGIGTEAPVAKLHVGGNSLLGGPVGIGAAPVIGTGLLVNDDLEAIRIAGFQPSVSFYNSGNYKGYVGASGSDDMEFGTAGANTNGRLLFNIKGAPYLTIQSNGQVSVNGPPAPFANPALTANGFFAIINGNSEWTLQPDLNAAPGGPALLFFGDGFPRGKIDPDGDWVVLSDKRLKEEIQPYKPVLDDIKKMQVASYYLKHVGRDKKELGLVAQDAAQYFPEIVSAIKNKDGQTLLGVSYAKTGVLAIKAVQEQQAIIELMQQKIELLEKKLAALMEVK